VRASRGIEVSARLERDIQGWVRSWLELWQVGELAGGIALEFNRRMTRSLGRCRPDRAEIRLAHWVLEAPQSILCEVLCHELAHAACWHAHGAGTRPHGTEWKRMMRSAGFEPRGKLPVEDLPSALRVHTRSRLPWEHRCPKCDAHRNARREMPHWRCSRCAASGGDGQLQITRNSAP
jgi:predicted SprT family Zn-dependent metalloprotease